MGGRYGLVSGGCYGGDVSWVFDCVNTANCIRAFQAQRYLKLRQRDSADCGLYFRT